MLTYFLLHSVEDWLDIMRQTMFYNLPRLQLLLVEYYLEILIQCLLGFLFIHFNYLVMSSGIHMVIYISKFFEHAGGMLSVSQSSGEWTNLLCKKRWISKLSICIQLWSLKLHFHYVVVKCNSKQGTNFALERKLGCFIYNFIYWQIMFGYCSAK